ncbi:MAG: PKD domain-containing protein, partial [Cyclobacteriaceae bacterium]|nr:PKD domain-containing protein [Cyclobacteriaceae bacterium HetDA_MAG_MS6]
ELRAWDASGVLTVAVDSVEISSDVAPDIDFTIDASRCVANPNTFTSVNISGDIISYSWDFGDTLGTSSQQDTIYQYMTPGTYTVTLSVESTGGCNNSVSKELTIYPEPSTPDFDYGGATLCSNNEITFTNMTDSTGLEGVINYLWDFDGEATSTSKDTVYTFSAPGMKTVTLQAMIPGCTTSMYSEDISIGDGPVVSFSYTNNCYEEPIQFMDASIGSGITSYSWDFGDGMGLSSAEDTVYQYGLAGTYNVSLTVTNSVGCETTYAEDITVNDQPLAGIMVGDETTEKLPIDFMGQDLTLVADSIINWSWEFDMSSIGTGQNIAYTFDEEGNYDLDLIILTAQGCVDTATIGISVGELTIPVVDIEIDSLICRKEGISIINNSINTVSYEWDFCLGDLKTEPSLTDESDVTNNSLGHRLVWDGDSLYGFVTDVSSNKIIRLEYGESIENDPTVVDLGNPGGLLSNPEGLDILRFQGNWYIVVAFGRNNGAFTLLNFGGSLRNTPSSSDLGNFGESGRLRYVKLVEDNDSINLVTATFSASRLYRVNYGNSFLNSPTTKVTTLPNAFNRGVEVLKVGDNWEVLVLSDDAVVQHVDFGTDLYVGTGTVEGTYSFTGVISPQDIKVLREGDIYYGIVSNEGQPISIIDFKDLSLGVVPEELSYTATLPTIPSLAGMRSKGKSTIQGLNLGSSTMKRLIFESSCASSISFSEDPEPIGLNYSSSGVYELELRAWDASGVLTVAVDSVEISFDVAPSLEVTGNSGNCINRFNEFSINTSGNISTYSWDFNGDGIEDDTVATPSFMYDTTGTYTVRLDVDDGTCGNFTTEEITIYSEPPTPSFDIAATAFCTDSEITLTNQTNETGFDDVLTYEWTADGVPISSQRDTVYSFQTSGMKEIGIKTIIPGCESEVVTQMININEIPVPDFTIDSICLGETITFQNLSANSVSYSWDFGDGDTSILFSPEHLFTAAGDFTVTLTASDNTGGCVDQLQQVARVYPEPPAADFQIETIPYCIGAEIDIQNLTDEFGFDTVAYQWIIGDSDTLTSRDLTLSFDSVGMQTITLRTITNGCVSEPVEQNFLVNENPTASFSATSACLGEATSFTNSSTGATQFSWDFGDNFTSSLSDPDHLYSAPGNYFATLLVTDENGCTSSIEQEIVVSALPEPGFTFSLACEGDEINFQDISTVSNGDIVSWEWIVGEEILSTNQNPILSFPEAGEYEVRQVITSSAGCQIATMETVTVLETPQPTFTINQGCINETTTLTDITNLGSETLLERIWTVNGQTYSTSEVSHIFDESGNFEVSLAITAGNFCAATVTEQVTILPAAQLDFDIQDFCANEFTTIVDRSTSEMDPITSKTWQVDDEVIGNGDQLIFRFNDPGNYDVSLTAITESGCTFRESSSLEILEIPVAEFTPSTTYGVVGTNVQFENNSSAFSTFQWYLNGEASSTSEDFNATLVEEGLYNIDLVATSTQGCQDTTSAEILIAAPAIDLILSELLVVENNGTGSLLVQVQNQGNLPVDLMEFTISLEDQFSVTETVDEFINIDGSTVVNLNTGIPLSVSSITYLCVTVRSSYTTEDTNNIDNEVCINLEPRFIVEEAFPNPARDAVTIKSVVPSEGSVFVTLINMSGKIETTKTFDSLSPGLNSFTFDLSSYDPGIYMIRVVFGDTVSNTRVIKI